MLNLFGLVPGQACMPHFLFGDIMGVFCLSEISAENANRIKALALWTDEEFVTS